MHLFTPCSATIRVTCGFYAQFIDSHADQMRICVSAERKNITHLKTQTVTTHEGSQKHKTSIQTTDVL